MKIGRLFGGKSRQDAAPPPASQSPKQISSGFIMQKAAAYENLYPIIIPDDRRPQLDALAFVVHTINQQHGVTASVGELSYSYLKPEGLYVTFVLKTESTRATMPLKLWVEGSGSGRKILLERDGLSKIVADFMTKEGREDIFSRIATALAGRKQSVRIQRLRNAYLEQAIAEHAGHPVRDQETTEDANQATQANQADIPPAIPTTPPLAGQQKPPKP